MGRIKAEDRATPLHKRIIVPLLRRLIPYDSERHLLILLFNSLLGESHQLGCIIAFDCRALAVEFSNLSKESVSHENDHNKREAYVAKDVSLGVRQIRHTIYLILGPDISSNLDWEDKRRVREGFRRRTWPLAASV